MDDNSPNHTGGNQQGITLAELLVASILIGIVMIGIASFGSSIRQMQGNTSKSTYLAMKTKVVMAMITEDAYKTAGDITDEGIAVYKNGGENSICFRHDVNTTPDDYTDDAWVAYYKSAGGNPRLNYCGVTPCDPLNLVTNPGQCNAGDPRRVILEFDPAVNNFFDVVPDLGLGPLQYIEFTLATIYDQTQAADPVSNPSYTLTSRISPPGRSQ